MDTVTQFALGACVGVGTLGRRLGPRRAAIAGGLLGTAPDLDVLVPFDDPVDEFVLHRGWTHSLIVQAVAAPLFGEALRRAVRDLRDHRMQTYLAVYLCFATHALLDAMTVYGTRLLWPLSREPSGVGSVFIIDPLYTLPLLVATLWALFRGDWTRRFRTGLIACLALSTAYLGWGVVAQNVVERRARAVLARAGGAPERLIAIPTPFNSLYWRVIAMQGDRYVNLYMPAFGGRDRVTAYSHPTGRSLIGCLGRNPAFEKLAWFSRGFYRLDRRGGEIALSDLRMGLTPNYSFRFVIARDDGGRVRPVEPRRLRGPRRAAGDLDWLLAGLAGAPVPRRTEDVALTDVARLPPGRLPGATAAC